MPRKKPMQTIGFRLADHHITLLEKGATAYGVSVHDRARQLLIEALDDTERERLRYEIVELQEELAKHREEFALAVKAILDAIHTPERARPERVEEWVADNLRT